MKFVPELLRSNPVALTVWRLFRDAYLDEIGNGIAENLPKLRRQTIVQIGTNDGLRDDPLFHLLQNRPLWRALLVEPLPKYHRQLIENYGKSRRFMYEQSAVGTESGVQSFYSIDERARQSPHWRDYFDRIGSLSRADLIINLGDEAENMAPYIVEEKINVVTMKDLLKKWSIGRVDALFVDAEGYDWEIVRQTFELGMRPKVLLFEFTHLTTADAGDAFNAVAEHYSTKMFDRDCLCVLRE